MDGSSASSTPVAKYTGSLYPLALGTFAVGTEGFMIAGILPKIASDLTVSPAAIGQLVTIFAFAYALSSPILTALSGHLKRRTVLIGAMSVFVVANLFAAVVPSYGWLMAARVVLAFSAGVYTPGANALAGALVPPERRGFAIAIINAGLTVAIALGVPLGTLVATTLSWRMTFVGVAVLAAAALIGLVLGLPKDIGAQLPVATLKERIVVARRRDILSTLLVTTLWATGAYTMYTYLALFLRTVTGIHGAQVGYILFTWGVSAAIGVLYSGKLVDRRGARAVTVPALFLGAMSFVTLSLVAHFVPLAYAVPPVVIAIVVWGLTHWGFYPGQQSRLMGIAGLHLAPIALSLNASFMYLGFSLGAAMGSLIILYSSASNLGWGAAAFELVAVGLMAWVSRHDERRS
jgi:predicted MFS family arabinose efflux permease